MKIAFTGAHGTGKTTLARLMPDALSAFGTVAVCREAARLVIANAGDQDFFKRGNNTPLRQSLIYIEQLIEERRLSNAQIMVTDRTMVDHLTYSAVLFPEHVDGPEFAALKRLAFETLADYSLIFKLDREFAVLADGVRESDPEFQSRIDETLVSLYAEAGAKLIPLRGSVVERVNAVVEAVQLCGKRE